MAKFVTILSVVLCLTSFGFSQEVESRGGGNNLIICQNPVGEKLFSKSVRVEGSFLFVRTSDVYFPGEAKLNDQIIGCIKILDRVENGKGGFAAISRGGVGYTDVGIHLWTRRGRGMKFDIEIYARPITTTTTM